ncbi:MAG: MFS transporter, partial [Bacteroidales bacterium]|nr:MFS transporter [Bacteroidales bacterium]
SLGLDSFRLFKDSRMAIFMIFSALIGMCLQITNSFANPFITSFGDIDTFKDTFGVQHANILISLSQVAETLCILLIPFFLKKFGIKKVMLISMTAWVLRFGFFGLGDPGSGVWLFVLSCIVYGVAFDFFNISGSLYVNETTDSKLRSSAQGLFMLMTNGIGATVGTLAAQAVINANHCMDAATEPMARWAGWSQSWYMFAAYALVLTISFALIFKYKHNPDEKKA